MNPSRAKRGPGLQDAVKARWGQFRGKHRQGGRMQAGEEVGKRSAGGGKCKENAGGGKCKRSA